MNSLSIVIPAYNEAQRLPSTLKDVHKFLSEQNYSFEIIVVDDGSSDETGAVVQQFAREHDGVKLLSYSENRGKGYAVRYGMLRATGSRILFNDADGSSPIQEISKLNRAMDFGADIAIGSRNVDQSLQSVKTTQHRKHIGNLFNMFVQCLLLPGLMDTQCGFKLFRRAVARDIFGSATKNGFSFDVEILAIARARGYKISEIPINWTNADGSKVNLISDPLKMGMDVVGLYLRKILGLFGNRSSNFQLVEEQPIATSETH